MQLGSIKAPSLLVAINFTISPNACQRDGVSVLNGGRGAFSECSSERDYEVC